MERSVDRGWRHVSRRTLAYLCFAAVGLGIAAVLLVVRVDAARGARGYDDPGPAVGTWNQVVHVPGRGDHQTVVTFNADGTMSSLSPNEPSPCASGTPPCTLEMPGLGIWVRTGWHTFDFTFKEYIYDSSGNLNGFIIPHDSVTISADGNSCSAVATTGIWTVDGTAPVFTVNATANATRMKLPPY